MLVRNPEFYSPNEPWEARGTLTRGVDAMLCCFASLGPVFAKLRWAFLYRQTYFQGQNSGIAMSEIPLVCVCVHTGS